jgi:hypothetical protein
MKLMINIWLEEFAMKNIAISEDEECWSIAESMVEEIGMIKLEKLKPKANFKVLLTNKAKVLPRIDLMP